MTTETEQQETAPRPTETVDFWKQKAREQERRAKDNADAAKRLAEIENAQKSEAQRAAERIAEAERKATEAESRALRREVALAHKLTPEDAALLDTITDEDAMRAFAARLATPAVQNGNSAPLEGDPPKQPLNDDRYAFVQGLVDRAH